MSNNIRNIIKVSLFAVLLFSSSVQAQIVHTIFGDIDEQNPVTIELLNHRSIQRLKDIDQAGPWIYFDNTFPKFSRYDHSVGVYALLKRYNVSAEEQIAGLMHDASHTAFSHLADYILQAESKRTESYQDTIHDWFLTEMGVPQILQKYNLALPDISPKKHEFTALEQSFPDMNADRIEYNLHTALLFYDLDQHDIAQILASLQYKDRHWYFTDITQAKKFAKLSNYYTRNFWGSKHNAIMYTLMSATLKYAIHHQILNIADLHFGIDLDVINKLKNCDDPIIRELLAMLAENHKYCVLADDTNFDIHFPVKMRGIDPLVLHNGTLQRLSSLSLDFKHDLQTTAAFANSGVYLKFANIDNPKLLQILKGTLN